MNETERNQGIVDEFKGERAKPLTECSRLATGYMKSYFKETMERASRGEPVVWMMVDCPQEICQAMDIPVFYPIHYSALVAAKQRAPYYLGVQNERGYFRDLCRYCGLALGCIWDWKAATAPWGGLPKPAAIVVAAFDDIVGKIYELFSRAYDIPLFIIDRTMPSNFPARFWEDPQLEKHRLERETGEYRELIRFLENVTRKTLTETRLRQTVDISNELFSHFIRAMNLVSSAEPCPIGAADHMANLICTNYFRGTEWGLQHAKQFYSEITTRINIGAGACSQERLRLGWVGPAPWFSPGFLNGFEEKYGAVVVWLGYIAGLENFVRLNFDDPVKALASRYLEYIACVQQLPPTGCSYYLYQAKMYKLDGMIFMAAESCKAFAGGIKFIQRELQAAGIPTLEINADIVDSRTWDDVKARNQVSSWIETLY